MNTKVIRIIKVILFIMLFGVSYIFCNTLFMAKGYGQENLFNVQITKNQKVKLINGFYEKDENSLDVVFIGSSHVFCDINPNIIWNSFGITSYDFASTSQDIYTSYYFLQEVLERQHPKVIFVDLAFTENEHLLWEPLSIHSATDLMPLNRNKVEFVVNRIYKEYWSSVFNPLERYHTRWKELSVNDFTYFLESKHDSFNGHYAYTTSTAWVQPELEEVKASQLDSDITNKIEEIITLCNKNNTEIIFTILPSMITADTASKSKAYESYFKNAGVEFINFNSLIHEIGLNGEKDFLDKDHLNYLGAEKLSLYLGGYITEHYSIADKRADNAYEIWNDDYQIYHQSKEKFENKVDKGE